MVVTGLLQLLPALTGLTEADALRLVVHPADGISVVSPGGWRSSVPQPSATVGQIGPFAGAIDLNVSAATDT
jgi:hypothetical protein